MMKGLWDRAAGSNEQQTFKMNQQKKTTILRGRCLRSNVDGGRLCGTLPLRMHDLSFRVLYQVIF